MFVPSKSYRQNIGQNISAFYGINRRRKAGSGEFRDMENLFTREEYPCLSSVRGVKNIQIELPEGAEIIKYMPLMFGVWDSTKFSGIAKLTEGTGDEATVKYAIYINGVKKRDDITEYSQAIDFGGSIITLPEMKGYNYLVQGGDPGIDFDIERLKNIEPATITFTQGVTLERASKTRAGVFTLRFTNSLPTYERFYEIFKAGDVIAFSSAGIYSTVYPATSQDYTQRGKPVVITITGMTDNVDGAVATVDLSIMDALGPTALGLSDTNIVQFSSGFTISKLIPQAAQAAAYSNRLWVTAKSGESVYVSALAKPFDFYIQDGLADASSTVPVSTPGEFVGINAWDNRVLAFKNESVSVIYGTDPTEYAAYKTYDIGCIDGDSIAESGNMLIWLYHDGFYAYAGGEPQRISDKLNTKYVGAQAFSTNRVYYARAEKEDGTHELLAYDTELNVWNKLTDAEFLNAFYFGGKTYIVQAGGLKEIKGGEYGDFYAETGDITFDSFNNKSIVYFYIRCEIASGFINLYTKTDGGNWEMHKGIEKSGKHKIPIRYKSGDSIAFRIEGSGKVYIDDMKLMINDEVR